MPRHVCESDPSQYPQIHHSLETFTSETSSEHEINRQTFFGETSVSLCSTCSCCKDTRAIENTSIAHFSVLLAKLEIAAPLVGTSVKDGETEVPGNLLIPHWSSLFGGK